MDNTLFHKAEALLIEEHLDKSKSRTMDALYPSKASIKLGDGSVVGECLRKLYYEYTKAAITDPPPVKALYKMGMGTAIHKWLLELFSKIPGVEIEKEVKFKDKRLKMEIHGRVDALSKDIVQDLKTTWGAGFKDLPKPESVLQARIYNHILGYGRKIEIDYLARDSANRVALIINDEELPGITYGGAVERWQELEKAIADELPPARDFKKDNWHCTYCPYFKLCWGEDKK